MKTYLSVAAILAVVLAIADLVELSPLVVPAENEDSPQQVQDISVFNEEQNQEPIVIGENGNVIPEARHFKKGDKHKFPYPQPPSYNPFVPPPIYNPYPSPPNFNLYPQPPYNPYNPHPQNYFFPVTRPPPTTTSAPMLPMNTTMNIAGHNLTLEQITCLIDFFFSAQKGSKLQRCINDGAEEQSEESASDSEEDNKLTTGCKSEYTTAENPTTTEEAATTTEEVATTTEEAATTTEEAVSTTEEAATTTEEAVITTVVEMVPEEERTTSSPNNENELVSNNDPSAWKQNPGLLYPGHGILISPGLIPDISLIGPSKQPVISSNDIISNFVGGFGNLLTSIAKGGKR